MATLPDSQRVESELLQQLRKYKTDCESMIRHNISSEPALVDTASAAAATLPDSQHVESELLQQLRKYKTDPGSMISHNIRDIIAQMEIEVTDVNPQKRQPSQRHLDEEWKLKKTSMFQSKRLNIFKSELEEELSEQASGLTLWDIDWANAIVESTNQRPRNGFEEMIKWTNEGKLWQYPINNEAGMDEEADVPFYEHVFLEKHLESFPQRGPVRHFMDLVIRGLSQNHQLTVQQKKDHINWFEDYFKEKQNVLKEAEA
ncbi:hypothetical protein DNTS_012069 [Danionella cerebrum]|uniref:Small ribosomal subunit protein mS31 n=1 Tax=Danionella cerebrum TaxID=2873325 RepID=A0A553PV55_9TELE|nr:hypothetical protein DNTS_012069 [Danionella translucida]